MKGENASWSLNSLHIITQTYHYLTLISPSPHLIFTPHHASCILSLLEQCELFIFTTKKNFTPINDDDIEHFNYDYRRHHHGNYQNDHYCYYNYNYNHPSSTDKLGLLYGIDSDHLKLYKQIIRMLFELIVSSDRHDIVIVNKIISRALTMEVSFEVKRWMIESMSLSKDKNDDLMVDNMDSIDNLVVDMKD